MLALTRKLEMDHNAADEAPITSLADIRLNAMLKILRREKLKIGDNEINLAKDIATLRKSGDITPIYDHYKKESL